MTARSPLPRDPADVSTLAVAVRCGDAKAVELICHGVNPYATIFLRVNAVVVRFYPDTDTEKRPSTRPKKSELRRSTNRQHGWSCSYQYRRRPVLSPEK